MSVTYCFHLKLFRMIFKHLFNWLKFKIIPASVLYKNRLFIERDSKARRVMSNFGLTFRNSKWSDYSTSNVSLKTRTSFIKPINTLIRFIVLLFLLWVGKTYFIMSVEISFFFETLWFLADLSSSYLAFWSGIFSISLHLLWLQVWTKLLSYIYGIKHPLLPTTIEDIFVNRVDNSRILEKELKLTHDAKVVIARSWVIDGTESEKGRFYYHRYFNQPHEDSSDQQKQHIRLFKRLYVTLKVLYWTRFSNVSPLPLDYTKCQEVSTLSTVNMNLFKINKLDQFFKLVLNFTETQPSPHYQTLNEKYSNTDWNLHHIGVELGNTTSSQDLDMWISGSFYLFNEDYFKLNRRGLTHNNMTILNSSLDDQIKILKWSRWLYRYNILHRKLIDNSHKITNTKKLISSGFFNSHLMSHNLWASDFFSRKNNKNLLKNQTQTLYGDVFQLNKNSINDVNKLKINSFNNSLTNTKFYEKSFFFFIHRFQMLNRMVNLRISSNVVLKNKNVKANSNLTIQKINNHSQLTSNLSRSLNASNELFYFFNDNSSIKTYTNTSPAQNDKMIWKEESYSSVFTLDSSNLLVNISEISDLSNNSLPVYMYSPITSYNLNESFQWSKKKPITEVKNRVSSQNTLLLNSMFLSDLNIQQILTNRKN